MREPKPRPAAKLQRRWRFVAGALAGLLGVEGALRAVEMIAGPERLGGAEVVVHERQLRDGPPPDTLVIGSSSSGADFWPAEMQRSGSACRAYTAWLANATVQDIARFTGWMLDTVAVPRQVVVGITMREVNANPSQASHERLDAFLERRGNGLTGQLNDMLAMIRMRRAVQDPVRFGRDLLAPSSLTVTADGHHVASLDRVIADESPQHRQQEIDELAAWALDPEQVDALEQLVGTLRQRGVGVVIVNLPVTDRFVSFAPNAHHDYEEYLSAVRDVAQRTGVAFFDGEQVELPEATLFADVNHLNQHGAERFTEAFTASRLVPPAPTCLGGA